MLGRGSSAPLVALITRLPAWRLWSISPTTTGASQRYAVGLPERLALLKEGDLRVRSDVTEPA